MAALETRIVLGPQDLERLQVLVGDAAALLERRRADRFELLLHPAGARAQHQTPLREHVDRGCDLGGVHRGAIGNDRDRGDQPGPAGDRREPGQQRELLEAFARSRAGPRSGSRIRISGLDIARHHQVIGHRQMVEASSSARRTRVSILSGAASGPRVGMVSPTSMMVSPSGLVRRRGVTPTDQQRGFLAGQRVARLATADAAGRPMWCRSAMRCAPTPCTSRSMRSRRRGRAQGSNARQPAENPSAALVVDRYDEDSSGSAGPWCRGAPRCWRRAPSRLAQGSLRARYPQLATCASRGCRLSPCGSTMSPAGAGSRAS